MTQTLEQQLTALCEAHGLTAISLHCNVAGSNRLIYANVHRGDRCASTDKLRGDSFGTAIRDAIARLPVAEVADLAPIGELAA